METIQVKENNHTIVWTYGILAINLILTMISAIWGYQQIITNHSKIPLLFVQHPWILGISLIVISIVFRTCAESMPIVALPIFSCVSIAIGFSFSTLGLIYPITTIRNAILATGILCAVLTIFSLQTKFDMTKLSGQMFGLTIAIIIIGLINGLLLHSGMVATIISLISTVVFGVWLMIDTQRLYSDQANDKPLKTSLIIAYSLYLDVINIFTSLLRIINMFTGNN